MISKVIKEKIEERFGKKVRYSKDCDALASDISFHTKQSVSGSTIRRLMGFVKGVQEPRTYTLDVIADYLGYGSFEELIDQFNTKTQVLPTLEELTTDNIDKGQKVRLLYDLGKELHITYCGEGLFEVLVADGKVLQPKDLIRFDRIGLSYPLFIEELEREGKRLGIVVIGKVSGITLIELMDWV